MKYLRISLIPILLIVALLFGTVAGASSFDDIMNLPDYKESDNRKAYLEFDDFLTDFQYYCKSWQGSFDTNKKQSKTMDDGTIILQLDGVTFWVCVSGERHEIKQISVKLGDPKNAYKAEYSMLIKAYALIASLNYEMPKTAAERSSILSSVMDDFQQNVEPAVKYSQTLGNFPVVFDNSHYIFAVTFSESEGYDFIAVIDNSAEKIAENKADSEKIPIEIIAVDVGKNASFKIKNNMDETLSEITVRVRYYDKDGKPILTDGFGSPVNTQISKLTIPMGDGGLIKTQSIVMDATAVHPFVTAKRVEIAIAGYKQEDGTSFYSPEMSLYWYSSDEGYQDEFVYGFSNQDYFDEWFADGKKITLGIYVDFVYPEFMDYYGVNQCGFLVTVVGSDSVLGKKGVKVGDVIWASNGQKWFDDPTILDRAKWELVIGKDVTLELVRGEENITVTISPAEVK